MKKINSRIRKSNEFYNARDTKANIACLAKYCNLLADKVDELIDEVEQLKKIKQAEKL